MNMKKLKRFFFTLLLICVAVPTSAKTPIVHLNVSEPKDKYHIDLLKFLFKDSENYQLLPAEHTMNESRQEAELEAGTLSVAAFAGGKEIEQRLTAIHIPILKGLLGHRIFIIRQDMQVRFSRINQFEQLLKFKAGQGKYWTDTAILKHAGIPTVVSNKYPNLFYMLEGGRFDYFPRAVHEPFSEVALRPELNLAIEPNLLLVYPLPLFLFVSKDNHELARVINNKLEQAIKDGSFDKFFFSHPLVKDALQKANIKDRTVFKIKNPQLSAATPIDRKELWLDVHKIDI